MLSVVLVSVFFMLCRSRLRVGLLHASLYNSTVFLWLCVFAKPWRGGFISERYLALVFQHNS